MNHGAAPWTRWRPALAAALAAAAACAACGKEGPPLPPLVRTPVAPAELRAERRGDAVDIQLVVPSANTDGSRPADIERVDVYAITATPPVTDEQVMKLGMRVGSVEVRPPADEDAPPPAEPVTDVDVSGGVDQGATAHVAEDLAAEALTPADLPAAEDGRNRPLVGPPPGVLSRTYAAVGVSRRGRRGPMSARASVPLVAAPPPPLQPHVEYNETEAVVSWDAAPGAAASAADAPADSGVLPSRPIGMSLQPTTAYHVYELAASEAGAPGGPRRLTEKPLAATTFSDPRVVWDAERCYTVSVVKTFDGLSVESDAAPPRCVTFVDSFPPETPSGVTAVASEGGITLIWEASRAADAAGYRVFRAALPATEMQPVTPAPTTEASYRDTAVTAGDRYVYTVRAVDKAGNISAPSEPVEETAR